MKVKSRLVPVSIISLLCLFSIMLGSVNLVNLSDFINPSNSASAMSFQSEQGLAFTINPTVNITVSGDLVINNLTPGNYKDSNIITVTASSNALAGYTLSSTVGNSTNTSPSFDNTNLNHTNGTNTFTNLATNISSLDNFDSSSNTWGYSWCDGTCTSSTASTSWVSGNVGSTQTGYNGLPIYTTSSPIQLINSNSAGSSTISFKIGARATSTQVSGTYANIVNFIGVGKVITTSYTINYNANGGSNAPTTQTGTTTDGAMQLSSTQPTKSDYIFKGWCTIDNTSDPTTCTGTGAEIIQPSGFLALEPGTSSSTATVTKTLYAVWESNTNEVTIADATYLQEVNSCPDTLTTGQVYTLTDSRDNNTYHVARLEDGNCWMLDNLALDLTDSTVQSKLNVTTTNASDLSLSYLKGINIGTTDDQYATAPVSKAWTSSAQDSYIIPMIAIDSNTSGLCRTSSECVNSDLSWSSDDSITSTFEDYNGDDFTTQGKIGIYYNLCAVSAGSYCWSTLQPYDDEGDTVHHYVTEDICPKGWRLPGDEWDNWENSEDDYRDAVTSHQIPLSGEFHSGKSENQLWLGELWSSYIEYTNGYMLGLSLGYTIDPPEDVGWNTWTWFIPDQGYSARCILNN